MTTTPEEVPIANRPFTALVPLAFIVAVILGCGAINYTGNDGKTALADAATNVVEALPSSEPEPEPTKENNKDVAAPGRDVPLRPPPNDACVTQHWCGKRIGFAAIIVDVGYRETNLPKRAWIIAVATAMQESTLMNQGTKVYPVTERFPYDKLGADHDSVGLFQQRPASKWGNPEELMNPRIAAKKFYNKLGDVVKSRKGWEDPKKIRLTDLAQAVQNSAYPEEYQKHEGIAAKIVDLVLQHQYTPEFHRKSTQSKWFVMFQCGNPKAKSCGMIPWELITPVVKNRDVFGKHFPKAELNGHLGDWHHQNDDPPQDHTSAAKSCYGKVCNVLGWVYAQDFGNGEATDTGFDVNRFVRWLLDELRAHPDKYKEVKYVISTIPNNKGSTYYGIFLRENGWAPQASGGHDDHVHISYMPGFERANSSIVADYVNSLK